MSVCLIVFSEKKIERIADRLEGVLACAGLGLDCVLSDPEREVFLSAVGAFDRSIVIGEPHFETGAAGNKALFFKELDGGAEKEIERTLKEEFSLIPERFVFSLYGNLDRELKEFQKGFSGDNGHIGYFIRKKDRRSTVDFLVKKGCSTLELDSALKAFITRFKNEIYADEDVSVEQRFFDILKLSKRRVRFAESMTGGNICATVVKVPGASEVIYEGFVTYDTRSKIERLGVSPETVERNTVVSGEVALEMVKSLIDETASVGISITGYAPSIYPSANDGLCYIGVAVDEDLKVYRFVFTGDRETVIKKATEAAIFSALKLLSAKC